MPDYLRMKHIIITGSSGMIGGLVLNACLQRPDVGEVTSIVRKPSGMKHAKLNEIVHTDYLGYSAIEAQLKGQDVCFYCIGVYTGQVPADEFNRITIDYTRAFSEALQRNSPGAAFCFLSGAGADSSEKSRILFAKAKGIAENQLQRAGFSRVHIFRPGYIYPVTPRKEPNFSYRLMRALYKPVSAIYPNIGITSERLAAKMVSVGMNGGDKIIYENKDIRA